MAPSTSKPGPAPIQEAKEVDSGDAPIEAEIRTTTNDDIELAGHHGAAESMNYAKYVAKGTRFNSVASVEHDGRITVSFDWKVALPEIFRTRGEVVEESAVDTKWKDSCPIMNIVIMIVGSRGDVQPYVALGQKLRKNGHRVRLATHETFQKFVLDAGLEFFNIGGDPQDLMSYMVKNPGLIPGYTSLINGDIGKKRKMLAEMVNGCWSACHSPCPLTGQSFVADAIISNPPAFAHIHCAEALGIPLLASFTMPWSPTISFPHPLVNVIASNIGSSLNNYLSYAAAEILQWQGVGDIINNFRTSTLGLPALSLRSGPGILEILKVPWTYCMSPALVPKPPDWKNHIDVVGFYFLDLATTYKPPDDLVSFLKAGDPPVYVGFGSVVVDDPAEMTQVIFDATKDAGVRALVSVGWGGLGNTAVPSHVFMLGNVPHDWLFDNERVAAVVHHGGAGTTAIGLAKGRPTVVVPFFGDQGFWGNMIYKAGAGPKPIPPKELKVKNFKDAITFAISPQAKEAAAKLGEKIREENGVQRGVDSFYRHLPLLNMRCDLDPSKVAIWWSKGHCLKLSAFAAQVLADAKAIDVETLVLHRSKEYKVKKSSSSSFYDFATSTLWGIKHSTKSDKHSLLDDKLHADHCDCSKSLSGPNGSYLDSSKSGNAGISNTDSHSKTESAFHSFKNKAGHVWGGVKRSGLSLVTLPFHASKQPKVPETQEHPIHLTRMEEGRKAVELSSPAERALILKRFADECAQTPLRLKIYNEAVEKERAEEANSFEDVGDVDARFARDMEMAMKLSQEQADNVDEEE